MTESEVPRDGPPVAGGSGEGVRRRGLLGASLCLGPSPH
jgi:hypothetical protein